MRYKTKAKDCRLIVRAKTSIGESFDEKALDAFSRVFLRGFLRAKIIKKNIVEYSGPIGISLYERLKSPISKRDFLFIMEQFILSIHKIEGNNLRMNHVVLDLQNVYINDITKEVQFLYVPLSKGTISADIMNFVESVVYSVIPANEKDSEFISRFIHFVKAQDAFAPDAVEKYIAKEDRSVVNTLKKQNVGQSGFMTNNPQHYHEHYDEQEREADEAGQESEGKSVPANDQKSEAVLANNTKVSVTSSAVVHTVSNEAPNSTYDEEETGLLVEDETDDQTEEETGLLVEDEINDQVEEETGLLVEDENDDQVEEETGLLVEDETDDQAEDGTGLLTVETTAAFDEEGTSLLAENETVLLEEDDGTALLQEQPPVIYPSLFRVLNEEVISVNKPVFRLGKERSYVDYFVTNNNAVSRSHADIITRGDKYFVIDLNSKNHTYINDQMIAVHCETEIRDGDRLKLGNEEFVFQIKLQSPSNVCRRCGKKIEQEGKFCVYCGCKVEQRG